MKKLLKYLNQPYPINEGKGWQTIVGISVLVFLILAILQPFGIHLLERNKWLILTGYMLVTALCTSLYIYLIPFLFQEFYKKFTIWKKLLIDLLVLLTITIGNSMYQYILSGGGSLEGYLKFFIIATVSVGFIPLMLLTFYQQNRLLKQNLAEAGRINETLINRTTSAKEEGTEQITLTGNTRESISCNPADLLYIEACGNYVKINYLSNSLLKQKLLRATIKQIEEETTSWPSIIRCHRAFLVNLNRIKSVKGNSQGYHLVISHTQEEIPVSRSYTKTIREHIQ